MKRKLSTLIISLALAVSLSACGSAKPTSSNNSDAERIEELEQDIKELKKENEQLKEQLGNSAENNQQKDLKEENGQLKEQLGNSAENNQQSVGASENILKATIESPETSGVCGANLTWYYQNGVLAITGTGKMTDYDSYYDSNNDYFVNTPWWDLREKVGWVIIDEGVTTIGTYAFNRFETLSKVTLPNTLTDIRENAFCDCENLSEITIPDSVASIGEYAFSSCENLSEITIPDSVTSIGWAALSYGDDLITIQYKEQSYTVDEFYDLMRESGIMND